MGNFFVSHNHILKKSLNIIILAQFKLMAYDAIDICKILRVGFFIGKNCTYNLVATNCKRDIIKLLKCLPAKRNP